jgi:ribosome-associated toxin RatA of RatAB toxin-antitoxin module
VTLLSGTSDADVPADVQRCWAIVADVERWPDWQQGLEHVGVVQRDGDGRPVLCDVVVDAKITKMRCRVTVTYAAPSRLEFTRVSSDDVDVLEGSWELAAAGPGATKATYRLAVDPGHVGLMARPLERALRPIVVGRRGAELAREVVRRS